MIILPNLAFRSMLHIFSSGPAASCVPHVWNLLKLHTNVEWSLNSRVSDVLSRSEPSGARFLLPFVKILCCFVFLICQWKNSCPKQGTLAPCQRSDFLCSRCWHSAFYEEKYILTFNQCSVKCWRLFEYLSCWVWFNKKKKISLAVFIRLSFSIHERNSLILLKSV